MAKLTTIPSTSNNANISCFHTTVCLYEWWLVKAKHEFEGKRLAIGGIASKKEVAVRAFTSAPITKRHDLFSLETADGVYIIIRGFINEQRTIDNGFPPEVFEHFFFGFPQNWESYAADLFRDKSTIGTYLGSAVPKNVSSIDPEISSDGQEKSIPSSSKPLKEAFGAHGKPHPEFEWNDSDATCGVNAAQGSGSIRGSARFHNMKVHQQKKPASGVSLKHPEELNSPVTPVQLQSLEKVNTSSEHLDESSTSRVSRTVFENKEGCSGRKKATSEKIGTYLGSAVPKNVSSIDPEISSDGQEKSIPSSSKPLKEAFGAHGKPHPEFEWNDSDATCGVNAAQGSGSIRGSARFHNMKVHQQKKPASGVSLKHPEELNSPVTPVQLQSLEKVNTSSEHLDESSTSRVSRTLFENKEGCSGRKKATSEKIGITNERKRNRSATATKCPQKRGVSPPIIVEKEKISSVSSLSSFKKSRSGRLLLPPLEFWRNQIPIYNADHEVTEIQGSASVVQ